VRRFIEPERLLVYEVKQGWEPLCKFLKAPVSATPFPVTNTTEQFLAFNPIGKP
jgi:Sulfotransferase domain